MTDIVERIKDAENATHALFNYIFQDAREEIERLRAKIKQMEKQEPVAWMRDQWSPDCGNFWELNHDDEMGWRDRKDWVPLYALPGAKGE